MAHGRKKLGFRAVRRFRFVARVGQIAHRPEQVCSPLLEPVAGVLKFGDVIVQGSPIRFQLMLGVFAFRDVDDETVADYCPVGVALRPPGGVQPAEPLFRVKIAEIDACLDDHRVRTADGGLEQVAVVGVDALEKLVRCRHYFVGAGAEDVDYCLVQIRIAQRPVDVQPAAEHDMRQIFDNRIEIDSRPITRISVSILRAVARGIVVFVAVH